MLGRGGQGRSGPRTTFFYFFIFAPFPKLPIIHSIYPVLSVLHFYLVYLLNLSFNSSTFLFSLLFIKFTYWTYQSLHLDQNIIISQNCQKLSKWSIDLLIYWLINHKGSQWDHNSDIDRQLLEQLSKWHFHDLHKT